MNGERSGTVLLPLARLAAFLAATALGAFVSAQDEGPVQKARVARCLVSLIDEVEVPAQEAGVLTALEVREGSQVEEGVLLAQVDDRLPQQQKEIALAEQKAAEEKADSDVDVAYAQAAAEVVKAEHAQAVEANERQPNTIPLSEVRRRKLAVTSATLRIKQAELERRVAQLTAQVKGAEVAAAETGIDRRQVRAPVAGLVTEVLRQRGEWVQPGEPVVRMVRVDRLRVEGFLQADELAAADVDARPVTVTARLARGREATFDGKIVFVHPRVEADGEYRFWAEVVNRDEDGHWLLRPGMEVELTIELAAP
jgi:macrolide-specific efflux system membrane fusion protein